MNKIKKLFANLALVLVAVSPFATFVAPVSAGQAGTTLTAEKSASGDIERTYHWTISKAVTPENIDMFTGDSKAVTYTVTVEKDAGTDVAYVSGQVCVTNGGSEATEGLAINDVLTAPNDKDNVIMSTAVDVSGNPSLAPGETHCYSYKFSASGLDGGETYKNTANVTITNHSGSLGTPKGPSPSATFVMPTTPTKTVNDSINVDDSNGGSWAFSASSSVSYDKTFMCDADMGEQGNTATIRETGQNDDATVTVNCYGLNVNKTADTSFDRTWDWTIDKKGDQTNLLLSIGQQFLVNYDVTVDASSTDANWQVMGDITVNNPAPITAPINGVGDVISGVGSATVDCGVTFPYSLAAGGTLTCSYSADLPNASSRSNTATATLQNSPSGTTDFTGSADVSFAEATMNEIDEIISVSDTYAGNLGTVAASDAPHTFTYSRWVGPYETAGTYYVDNTASFITNDTKTTDDDSWRVTVTVPGGSCTLTQGYWKTHSVKGPAPYDDAWKLVGLSEESTIFAKSGKTWYQVFWTPPAGNPYYNLAHQYMAARLNVLNGASTSPSVDGALTWATTFFNTYSPSSTLSKSMKNDVTKYASILASYNEGYIGPGHCSE